jgi:hypothetical protein
MTQVEKLIEVFNSGRELTAKQIASQFNIASPSKVISVLRREHGLPIYLNKRVDTKGRETNKYRLGTPTRSVVAAGYRALSFGI